MPALANRRDSMSAREPERGDHRSVAVVGAGITGLVTAYEMRRRGVNVTLFESSGHSGGAIRTTCTEGFLAEHGPNSFVTSAPVESLLTQLDLQDEVVEAIPHANRRYVVRTYDNPVPQAIDLSTVDFTGTDPLQVETPQGGFAELRLTVS